MAEKTAKAPSADKADKADKAVEKKPKKAPAEKSASDGVANPDDPDNKASLPRPMGYSPHIRVPRPC